MIVFIFDPMYSKTENQKFAQYSVKNRDSDSDFETETIENSSYYPVPLFRILEVNSFPILSPDHFKIVGKKKKYYKWCHVCTSDHILHKKPYNVFLLRLFFCHLWTFWPFASKVRSYLFHNFWGIIFRFLKNYVLLSTYPGYSYVLTYFFVDFLTCWVIDSLKLQLE